MRLVTDIEDAHREGRTLFRSFNKNCNLVTVAGTAQDLSVQSGNPPAQFYVGAIATATAEIAALVLAWLVALWVTRKPVRT